MFARITAVLVVLAGWACLPAGAAAGVVVSTGEVWAGGGAHLTIALVAPADECQLVAMAPNRTVRTLSQLKPLGTTITWFWRVPRAARSATWRLLAYCGSSELGAVLTVHGRRHRTALALARQIRVLQYGAAADPVPLQVSQAAQSWWTSNSTWILSTFHSGASTGECTDYLATLRPDIVERVDMWAYAKYLLAQGGSLGVNWAAKYWAVNAQRAGIPTGNIPRAGAVVVFQPGAYGAFSKGHVAYVDAVAKDGSFTISQMHAPVIGRVTSEHYSARTALAMSVSSSVTFIYS